MGNVRYATQYAGENTAMEIVERKKQEAIKRVQELKPQGLVCAWACGLVKQVSIDTSRCEVCKLSTYTAEFERHWKENGDIPHPYVEKELLHVWGGKLNRETMEDIKTGSILGDFYQCLKCGLIYERTYLDEQLPIGGCRPPQPCAKYVKSDWKARCKVCNYPPKDHKKERT